jgi:hypothetical protein
MARYVHWQDGEMWLGYFEEFPDYLTQGESLGELEENLRDLYRDLTSGEIPGIRSSQIGRGRLSFRAPWRKSRLVSQSGDRRPAFLSQCPGIGRSTNSWPGTS